MNINQINKVKSIFSEYPEVKLAYLFGSQVTNNTGPLSDYDFAIYLDEKDTTIAFRIKARLIDELSRLLRTDAIDIVILDTAKGTELKYDIISQGVLLHAQEPYKVIVEPRILNEYFDFKSVLQRAKAS